MEETGRENSELQLCLEQLEGEEEEPFCTTKRATKSSLPKKISMNTQTHLHTEYGVANVDIYGGLTQRRYTRTHTNTHTHTWSGYETKG